LLVVSHVTKARACLCVQTCRFEHILLVAQTRRSFLVMLHEPRLPPAASSRVNPRTRNDFLTKCSEYYPACETSTEVTNAWSLTHTPRYVLMTFLLIKHRHNFGFTVSGRALTLTTPFHLVSKGYQYEELYLRFPIRLGVAHG
jgi:hypothetical protein